MTSETALRFAGSFLSNTVLTARCPKPDIIMLWEASVRLVVSPKLFTAALRSNALFSHTHAHSAAGIEVSAARPTPQVFPRLVQILSMDDEMRRSSPGGRKCLGYHACN
ncbi:hypothetical protein PoB_006286000 [Plakobranchus ocellatus]|uniref:Uncharacterized protein n=1 Tax=Plakobranchus ocellatus TaxID=259542 RepID=A0AAV4CWU3_9GAST|nr:hypothetical protein PoB_006286000 [Plakobranchus ocellatus]